MIVGCGGFGREVADVVDAINRTQPTWNLLGFIDDSPKSADVERVNRLGRQIIGDLASEAPGDGPVWYVIGIGDGKVRESIASRLDARGWRAATLVHPGSALGADCKLGEGAVVCAGASITTNVTVGRHVHINLNCTVGHDSRLADFVTLNPLVAISGNCSVEIRAQLGTHSAVLPGLTIGKDATVGAAACVVRDVASNLVVKGIPAR
ncbi:MAG: acetyltransferase [Kineosporiaceae bacterium]|nr:acetyltransferase [Aeromicrobium sp.]